MPADHLKPSPQMRITAKQAQERILLGLFCRWCLSGNRKLVKLRHLAGYGCATCTRLDKQARSQDRKNKHQVKTYGITQEEKDRVLEFQDGGCICAPWTGYNGASGRGLSTDHDHETGIVRGVLCKHCNDLLGRIKDDPTYFRLMIAYLANPPAVQVLGPRVVPQ